MSVQKRTTGGPAVNGSDHTLWQGVAQKLRADIDSGKLRPGDTIPAEHELAAQWDVSRDTVRRALVALTQEGLLTRGQGRRGRQVRRSEPLVFYASRTESAERLAARKTAGTDAWIYDVHEQGREGGQSISVAIEEAPADIASRLGIAAGDAVVVRRRLRTVDGEPSNLNDTYHPAALVEGTAIMHPADVKEGTIALLAALGYEQDHTADEIQARMPTPEESSKLRMQPGVPVIVQYRTGWTAESLPIKLTITVWTADRSRLIWESRGDS